ncbi:Myb/SANT-like DNA-binding domain [Popillia japonica]|uniref:Regulatory protein zeste n=1 Tax=Popillia japonica TaxID=7064 RepID=A0AAW1NKS6_POPJA
MHSIAVAVALCRNNPTPPKKIQQQIMNSQGRSSSTTPLISQAHRSTGSTLKQWKKKLFSVLKNRKKVRGKNFNEQEALDLLSLVANHKKIIENKQTNATTNQEKIHVWKSITEQYNTSHPLNTRNLGQLSAKYENLKHRARKYAAQNKQELYSTGGGPAQTVTDVVLDSVLSIIPKKRVKVN